MTLWSSLGVSLLVPLLAAAAQPPAVTLPKTPDDLAISLVASEPLLTSPSDIDVDSRGRIWVCEVTNYRGKRNTRAEGDRILVLEDTDGDGRSDKQTVFHQGRDIDSALGICVIGEGKGRRVVVSCAPNVFVFHDDDGDLKADRRESLFTKIGVPQHDHSTHAFVVGPDGRLYFNFGNTGKAVHDKDGQLVRDRFGNPVDDSGKPFRQGMVFRCKPDGSDFEVLGHNFRNNYEVAVDSFGGLWQSDNDDDGNKAVRINWVMPYGNFGYVDERTGSGWQLGRTNLEPEVPRRHWHQNDPGVVPNLLVTGAGSPTGICVAEDALLPERFRGAVVHCDAGPNVVRAYHVKPAGAGYSSTIETVADGSADRWFRPSDVCVAPDGSLIVADWHDPGVGGHGMGDVEKGRIYRIATKGAAWRVPAVDVSTVQGAIAALGSPNLCTRSLALESLAQNPDAARESLAKAFTEATDARLRSRLAWAAGMLPGQADAWIAKLAADADDNLRAVAVRMCRLAQADVVSLAEKLSADPSPAVRREAAIALRGVAGERADAAWAKLAVRHKPGDRWELEALGIGADGGAGLAGPSQWDGRLAAWLNAVGPQWKQLAGREIVWRSRAPQSPKLLCELLADPSTTTNESLGILRALDFQDSEAVLASLRPLVKKLSAPEEKLRVILAEAVLRLDRGDASDADLRRRIDEAAGYADARQLIEIVGRFGLRERLPQLVALAGADDTSEQLAATAVAAVLAADGGEFVQRAIAPADPTAVRLATAVGITGARAAVDLLTDLVERPATDPALAATAVKALARSRAGAERLVMAAKDGKLVGSLPQVAGVAIASCPWGDIRQAAADVLPLPKAKGGALPAVAELTKRQGVAARGKEVFAGVGTCAKCHVVGAEGKAVGPNLSGIGAKLSRPALYESILAPSAAISHSYETWTAVLDDGRSVSGLLVSQSPEKAVIKGADGIDVTLEADAIEELVKQSVSLMPADLATALTADELVDLVAWLETLRATN